TLIESPNRDLGRKLSQRILGLIRGWLPPKDADVHLLMVPPFPLWSRPPTVALIHDLRWMRTRTGLSRAYRAWDLRRTVKRAESLLCISERSLNDLVEFAPSAASKARVVHLGPGLFEAPLEEPRKEPGTVLLVGAGHHKRN